MIKARLAKQGMFSTPRTDESLLKYMESFSGPEKVLAYTVSGMTWNRTIDKISELSFDDFEVSIDKTHEALWVTVGNISVRICRSDEGAICDMYTLGVECLDEAHLSGCYAFFDEAKTEQELMEDDNVQGHPI